MPNNIDLIATYLATDPVLLGTEDPPNGYTGLLQGGIWTRKLKRERPGRTLQAFTQDDKSLIRPSLVLVDTGDALHPQEDYIPTAYQQQILLYYYAAAGQSGKDTITAARNRSRLLLESPTWLPIGDDGFVLFVKYLGRFGVRDSEEFAEAIFDFCTYTVTSRQAAFRD